MSYISEALGSGGGGGGMGQHVTDADVNPINFSVIVVVLYDFMILLLRYLRL